MASPVSTDVREHPASKALVLVVATLLSIGLGNAFDPSMFTQFWSAICVAASLPVVLLSLIGQSFRRIALMVFVPPVVAGASAHLLWSHPFALLAAPACLWLTCLVVLATSPRRPSKTQSDRGRCNACGYDMRGSVTGACPECGMRAATTPTGRRGWASVAWTVMLWLVGVAAGLGLLGFMFYYMTSQPI